MNRLLENLTKHLVNVEEQKGEILTAFFPQPSLEREEFKILLDNYIKQVELHIRNISLQNFPETPLVIMGSEVELQDLDSGETHKFKLASPFEDSPGKSDVSYLSPTGKVLMLKNIGDMVRVDAPGGIFQYRIKSIKLPGE